MLHIYNNNNKASNLLKKIDRRNIPACELLKPLHVSHPCVLRSLELHGLCKFLVPQFLQPVQGSSRQQRCWAPVLIRKS